jgi:hypothetical protein
MKKFIVERNLPGAGDLTVEELQSIAQAWCEVLTRMGKPHHWIQSYIGADKIYCVHIAEDEQSVRQHAKLGKFPINTVMEIKTMIDPATSTSLPPKTNEKQLETELIT